MITSGRLLQTFVILKDWVPDKIRYLFPTKMNSVCLIKFVN